MYYVVCLFAYTKTHNSPAHWLLPLSFTASLSFVLNEVRLRSVSADPLSVTDLNRLDKFTSSITVRFHSLLSRLWSTVLAHASMLIVCHIFKWQLFVSLERTDWWCLHIQQVRSEIIFYKSCNAGLLRWFDKCVWQLRERLSLPQGETHTG